MEAGDEEEVAPCLAGTTESSPGRHQVEPRQSSGTPQEGREEFCTEPQWQRNQNHPSEQDGGQAIPREGGQPSLDLLTEPVERSSGKGGNAPQGHWTKGESLWSWSVKCLGGNIKYTRWRIRIGPHGPGYLGRNPKPLYPTIDVSLGSISS